MGGGVRRASGERSATAVACRDGRAGTPPARRACGRCTTQHAPVLLAYAMRLTDGDRARAEDIVQETLVRAWRHLDRLDESVGPVRPWLFTVAQRLAIDAHRARLARPHEVGPRGARVVPGLDELENALTASWSSTRWTPSPASTGR